MTRSGRLLSLCLTVCAPALTLGGGDEGGGGRHHAMEIHEKMIFDFGEAEQPWSSIDDPVMGGVSRSRMSVRNGIAEFAGVVSLENNGGFASTRSTPAHHDLETITASP